jgi:hypothetical protein
MTFHGHGCLGFGGPGSRSSRDRSVIFRGSLSLQPQSPTPAKGMAHEEENEVQIFYDPQQL